MGEPSSEVTIPPQALETKGADSNFGLSVNGSQLAALIYLQDLKARWIVDPPEGFNSLKDFVLNGKMKEANSLLLDQDYFLPEPFRPPNYEDVVREIKNSLSHDVDIEEVMKRFYYRQQPWHLNEFIHSLRGKPLSALPKRDMDIFLPQLGVNAHLFPTENILTLIFPTVDLPANQQHPYYIEQKEVFGEEGNENTLSILELFAELAKRYPNVFTHVITKSHLPSIIMSGHLGSEFGLREHESGHRHLFLEKLILGDVSEFQKTMTQLKTSAKLPTTSKDKPNNLIQKAIMQIKKMKTSAKVTASTETPKSPLEKLHYVNPQSISPIAIFSNQFSPEPSNQYFLADDGADIKDKCLIGIWVTPQYRKHLLYWISKWDDVKRQEVFGDRKPEDILISSAKDLPLLKK